MVSKNEHTGDALISRFLSKEGQEQFDKIFGVKPPKQKYVPPPLPLNEYPDNSSDEYSEDWQSSKRDKAIAQNGNVGYTQDEIDQ